MEASDMRAQLKLIRQKTGIGVLRAVYRLFKNKKRWTQKEFAKDVHGNSVSTRDERAVCFCVDGALCRLSANSYLEAFALLDAVCDDYITVNDSRNGYAKIMHALRQAIKAAS